jgi:hypothetical protein
MLRTLVPAALLASSLVAQSVVVPNANATTNGTGQLNSIVRNAANPRTYQYGINASELAAVPIGSVITGVSLRFAHFATNPVSWPPADITWSTYDISVGPAAPTAGWVADPALNFTSPPVLVRSGPMTLDANVFANVPPTTTPNPWAEFYFDFQTPYLYLGGDLAMLFSHPGSNDAATAMYPETVASNAAVHGVARVQSIYPAGTATAASTFYVMRVHYGYGAGCPGTGGQTPVLVQNGNLTGGTGGTISLQVANTQPGNLVVFALGFTQLSVPIAPGCDLLVSPDVLLVGFANANGRATQPITVPPAASGNFFAQGGVLDAGAAGGIAVSNGVSPSAN